MLRSQVKQETHSIEYVFSFSVRFNISNYDKLMEEIVHTSKCLTIGYILIASAASNLTAVSGELQ